MGEITMFCRDEDGETKEQIALKNYNKQRLYLELELCDRLPDGTIIREVQIA